MGVFETGQPDGIIVDGPVPLGIAEAALGELYIERVKPDFASGFALAGCTQRTQSTQHNRREN